MYLSIGSMVNDNYERIASTRFQILDPWNSAVADETLGISDIQNARDTQSFASYGGCQHANHSAMTHPSKTDSYQLNGTYTCLLLLISMLWHRQAIFKSKGDKLSSSAECRVRTQGLRHLFASRLNACWQTDWAIEIKLKTWTRQPIPMISKHSAHSTSLPVGFRTWLWRYTCLLLLISMLWHRQAIFESKRDKLSSSAECRIRTQGLRHLFASRLRLNACWQTDWAIEDQAKNSTAHRWGLNTYLWGNYWSQKVCQWVHAEIRSTVNDRQWPVAAADSGFMFMTLNTQNVIVWFYEIFSATLDDIIWSAQTYSNYSIAKSILKTNSYLICQLCLLMVW